MQDLIKGLLTFETLVLTAVYELEHCNIHCREVKEVNHILVNEAMISFEYKHDMAFNVRLMSQKSPKSSKY